MRGDKMLSIFESGRTREKCLSRFVACAIGVNSGESYNDNRNNISFVKSV